MSVNEGRAIHVARATLAALPERARGPVDILLELDHEDDEVEYFGVGRFRTQLGPVEIRWPLPCLSASFLASSSWQQFRDALSKQVAALFAVVNAADHSIDAHPYTANKVQAQVVDVDTKLSEAAHAKQIRAPQAKQIP